MGMIMQINGDIQISTKTKVCPSMALDVWYVKKIRWHQIIYHQVCNPSYPRPQLNQIHISKDISQKKKHRTSKYKKVWAWLNGLKEALLGDHDKITNRSSSRCVSCKWRWSCNSMKIYKSQSKGKYAPVWHQMYGRSKKLDNIRSSIIKCAIPIIHIHNWIGFKHHTGISQKKNHDGI